ncbi:hypothetical protein AS188_07665 [Kocuria flava]|uniref:Glycosyltransferase RgtA/B/C/D-like domain-containing protein n=1 Tax=Kocuria flava TaxID=446860 RepID=A0A0U2YVU1_9MICC|nr:glycosyltransferase family 39 protein [Kocuria flava]ALU39649.1 hypothetical protein AS188_07665 [Kocuria flava]GEO91728.1 hypothetical protein KFL01_10340 [Kocuria flava]
MSAPTRSPARHGHRPHRHRPAPARHGVPQVRGEETGRPGGRRASLRWPDRAAVLVLGLCALLVGTWNLTGATPYADDEGTYTAQAVSVLEGDLAPYTYQYDHPPLGWIQLGLLAWVPRLLGWGDGTPEGAARFAVVPFFVATVVLTYLVARRLELTRPAAVLTGALVLASPLAFTLGRQVYLDNIGLPWLLLAFLLALNRRKALWHHVGAGIFFALAVLSKETFAVAGPALLAALLNQRAWSNRSFSVVGFVVVGGLVLAFYPLMALLAWELLPGPEHVSLYEALVHQLVGREGSGSVWDSGSARAELVRGWLHYDAVLLVGGLVAGLACATRRRTAWLPVALAGFALPVLVSEGYLPAMFVVGSLPFLALAVGAVVDRIGARMLSGQPGPGGARPRAAGLAGLCVVVLALPAAQWAERHTDLLHRDANADRAAAVRWVAAQVPEEDTLLVPYAAWVELAERRRDGPWETIALEKADLDPEFREVHPRGWREVEWVVLGPDSRRTVDRLELSTVLQALAHAEVAFTAGQWTVHRVQG